MLTCRAASLVRKSRTAPQLLARETTAISLPRKVAELTERLESK